MNRLDIQFSIFEREGIITCLDCMFSFLTRDDTGAGWEREALAHIIAVHITVTVG